MSPNTFINQKEWDETQIFIGQLIIQSLGEGGFDPWTFVRNTKKSQLSYQALGKDRQLTTPDCFYSFTFFFPSNLYIYLRIEKIDIHTHTHTFDRKMSDRQLMHPHQIAYGFFILFYKRGKEKGPSSGIWYQLQLKFNWIIFVHQLWTIQMLKEF